MAHNYILQVTAGSEYDVRTHQIVPVNSPQKIRIDSEDVTVDLNVRIQSYRGLPRSSPTTSPYFDLPSHSSAKDQYSIAFKFTPKKSINGDDLVFGNDFDHPIRDRLPPGFSTAFKIVKWMVDPGLDGDVYGDKPYLVGPAGSSMNILSVGGEEEADSDEDGEDLGLVFEEGGDDKGLEARKEKNVPETIAGRKKWFLNEENRKQWTFEEGVAYGCDFFNPYLDFNDFALRLPGFTLPIMKYWDGQGLRYVLKDRATDKLLFCVLFTLYLKEDVNEDGSLKDGVEGGKPLDQLSDEQKRKHEGAKGGDFADGKDEKKEETGKDNQKVQQSMDDDID